MKKLAAAACAPLVVLLAACGALPGDFGTSGAAATAPAAAASAITPNASLVVQGIPPIPQAPRVRDVRLSQLRAALPWAARALGLPPPDGA